MVDNQNEGRIGDEIAQWDDEVRLSYIVAGLIGDNGRLYVTDSRYYAAINETAEVMLEMGDFIAEKRVEKVS